MLTHGNLIHNERMIQTGFGHGPDTIVTGWLPQFHDMGLIGNILRPIFIGALHPDVADGVPAAAHPMAARDLEPSGHDQRRPQLRLRTLRAEDHRRAARGRRPELLDAGLLRRRARCGPTLDLFAERFAPYGFQRRAFYPCYGLAESTLFVTGPKHGESARAHVMRRSLEEREVVEAAQDTPETMVQTLVGCGGPNTGLKSPSSIRTASCAVRPRPWSRSGCRARASRRATGVARTQREDLRGAPGGRARTQLPAHRRPWLHARRQLHVCGRLKDLIIIAGATTHPKTSNGPLLRNSNPGAWAAPSRSRCRTKTTKRPSASCWSTR